MKVNDIVFSDQFWRDYESVPNNVRTRFGRRVNRIAMSRGMLPSDNPHKAENIKDGVWIGYITQSRQAWRYFFYPMENGTILIDRIMTHNEAEAYLKELLNT